MFVLNINILLLQTQLLLYSVVASSPQCNQMLCVCFVVTVILLYIRIPSQISAPDFVNPHTPQRTAPIPKMLRCYHINNIDQSYFCKCKELEPQILYKLFNQKAHRYERHHSYNYIYWSRLSKTNNTLILPYLSRPILTKTSQSKLFVYDVPLILGGQLLSPLIDHYITTALKLYG